MYNGLEVDMLSVGNADCILVTRWDANSASWSNILIDGGNKGSFPVLRRFLQARNVSRLNAVVCTHLHDDHAAGLVELLNDKSIEIESAFMHVPQRHVNVNEVEKALKLAGNSCEAENIRKAMATSKELITAFAARGIPVTEPFAGSNILFLTVVGPTASYYEELIGEFANSELIKLADTQDSRHAIWSALHDKAIEALDTELPEDPQTTPMNNSSIILAAAQNNQKYLFTSDSGVPALQKASEQFNLAGCHWMQIPHHGSRRNINPALIKHFSPTNAWVSAEGSKKHPRRAVVNAFKQAGATVCSTHWPTSTNMWISTGSVPARPEYHPLVALYDAPPSFTIPPDFGFYSSLLSGR
jgi:beta-lactamase superfamily II metal-dependent hydrolase